jgi:hypothetical protein
MKLIAVFAMMFIVGCGGDDCKPLDKFVCMADEVWRFDTCGQPYEKIDQCSCECSIDFETLEETCTPITCS